MNIHTLHRKIIKVTQFYRPCFGGNLTRTRLLETLMQVHFPPEQHGEITHTFVKRGTVEFSATDRRDFTGRPLQGDSTAMYLRGPVYEELSPIFDTLSKDAENGVLVELR